MYQEQLQTLIDSYLPAEPGQDAIRREFASFISQNSDCLDRGNATGHLTASAWIVDPRRELALLAHHTKLDKWIQLGGHADGDPDLLAVAEREALEESGLVVMALDVGRVFDLDIHEIPRHGPTPSHLHYDVRFLFAADSEERLTISPESKRLRWIPLDQVEQFTRELSVLRMRNRYVRGRRRA